MALTKEQVLHFKALTLAWFHQTRRKVPKGFAAKSPTVGRVFRSMIRTYQTAHGLKRTGEIDTATQHSLTPVDPRDVKAAHSLLYHQWAVEHHNSFVYDQERPSANPPPSDLYGLPRGGRKRDCSLEAKDGAEAGGFTQPDLYSHESGDGNTDSILEWAQKHGKVVPIAKLRQGDLIIYSNPGHAITVVGTHANDPSGVLLREVSDGRPGAPEYTTHARELASHPGPCYGIAVD